jgi:predicted DNA-binding protein
MTTLTIDDELSQAIERMAAEKHKAVDQLVHDALIEMLQDYQDTRAAETVLADIESGKEQLLDWRDVKSDLYDMDH